VLVMKPTRSDPPPAGGLPILLALVAGYVDAYTLLAYGVYVSFMSGNTTQAGAMIGRGKLFAALDTAVAIALFVMGVLLGTWLTNSALRRSRPLLLGVIALVLAGVIAGVQYGSLASHAAASIAILALAMGLMNTTFSHIGAEPVNLTFVTGTLTKVGHHLGLALRRAPLPDAEGPWDTHLRRAGLMARVWAGFLSGAILSGAASTYFGGWALLAPCLILLTSASYMTFDRPRSRA
jgi:uncharacterized membrane protein YoaK (UPF0700 family)